MSAQAEEIYCMVCDHGVLDGVACDGKPEECPLKTGAVSDSLNTDTRVPPVRPIDCAQPDEYDFVRSED